MNQPLTKAALVVTVLLGTCVNWAAESKDDSTKAEAQFIDAAKKAFAARSAADLSKLTCWDHVIDDHRKATEKTYAALLDEKDVSFDLELVKPDLKFVDRPHTEEGVVYRANLPVVRHLEVTLRNKEGKILGVIDFPVGRKDREFLVAALAPAR